MKPTFNTFAGEYIDPQTGELHEVIVLVAMDRVWAHFVIAKNKTLGYWEILNETPMGPGEYTALTEAVQVFGEPYAAPIAGWKDRDVRIVANLTAAIREQKSVPTYRLSAQEAVNNGRTLLQYLEQTFTVACPLQDIGDCRRVSFPRADWPWEATWSSPYLTDANKAELTVTLDPIQAYSASKRFAWQWLHRLMTTAYPSNRTKHPFVLMHTPPGGGKTSLILAYAALHHIPCISLSCHDLLKLPQLMSRTGPVQDEHSGQAKLMTVATVLRKCLEHNLYVLLHLEEVNLPTVQFTNALSTLISDGLWEDGPITGRNSGTIWIIGAFNPATEGGHAPDEKIYDRATFIQPEAFTDEERADYHARKWSAEYGATASVSLQEAQQWCEEYQKALSAPHCAPTYVPGEWSSGYIGDAPVLSDGDLKSVAMRAITLMNHINDELRELTKGKDRTRSRNFYYYISDRNLDVFVDLIMCWSSVPKAVKYFIMNLLPGGGVLDATCADPRNDHFPETTAETICVHLAQEMQSFDEFLFHPATQTDAEGCRAAFAAAKAWDPVPANPIPATPIASNEAEAFYKQFS